MSASPDLLNRAEQSYLDAMQTAGVPKHLREELVRYLVHFIKPGDFLTAVLENNLKDALARSDPESRRGLYDLVGFLFHDAPPPSWGSPNLVREWLAHGQRKAGGAS